MARAVVVSRGKRYPPLLTVGFVLLIVLAVLPSSLNLPQSNPTETLEYAPVPPDDQTPPPAASGNLSSLGLGSSASLGLGPASEGAGGSDGPPDQPAPGAASGQGLRPPQTKKCVGNPPKQTADPLAPPCVGYFEGDNFGATYQGVTREEVRIILVHGLINPTGTSRSDQTFPQNRYYDLAIPPTDDDEPLPVTWARAWQRYFNDRYQTYNRFLHLYYFFPSGGNVPTAEQRRADAADNFSRIKPFGVVFMGASAPYNEVITRRGVIVFASADGNPLPASDYSRFPKLAWGFLPSIEEQARTYTSLLCTQAKGRTANLGGPAIVGKPRKYGLIYTTQTGPLADSKRQFKDVVKSQLGDCGIEIAEEATHPFDGVGTDGRTTGSYAVEAMQRFQERGITTILWPMGFETNFTKQAAARGYQPEWFLAGDLINEGMLNGQQQNPEVWQHARLITPMPHLEFKGYPKPCVEAYLEADPNLNREALDEFYLCYQYTPLRLAATAIQVAGPRLTPTSIDRGLHAIPPSLSTSMDAQACFFSPGDNTCVKDATLMRYDPEGSGPETGGATGCWRLLNGGQRYYAGAWPDEPVGANFGNVAPCTGHLGNANAAQPNPNDPPR